MSTHWPERVNDAVAARRERASAALTQALQAANDALVHRRDSGLEHARTLGRNALDQAQRAGRSTRTLVLGHPLESVLLAGLAGVVIGWVLRRARSPQPARHAARRAPAPRKSPQRRSGSRSAASKSP